MRKVCCVTGSRADYSRLRSVLFAIEQHPQLQLQLVVIGSHLLPRFGTTIDDIRKDGFKINAQCHMVLEGDRPVTMAKSFGLASLDLASIFDHLQPDLLLLMGDRYEAFSAATTAALLNIPMAHIQGGEVTGSVDESIRHAITKLSHLHFVATERSKLYVSRMGEDPKTIFNVGCPSIDYIKKTQVLTKQKLLSHPELERNDGSFLDPSLPYILALYHPVTTAWEEEYERTRKFLEVLRKAQIQTIYLYPNVDSGSESIIRSIRHYLLENEVKHVEFYKHFSFELFLSLMAHADCMVGNSSASIREACYWGLPVVNIGIRQQHREAGRNVKHVPSDEKLILEAIEKQMQHGKYLPQDLYGDGQTGEKIAKCLAEIALPQVQKTLHYVHDSNPATPVEISPVLPELHA